MWKFKWIFISFFVLFPWFGFIIFLLTIRRRRYSISSLKHNQKFHCRKNSKNLFTKSLIHKRCSLDCIIYISQVTVTKHVPCKDVLKYRTYLQWYLVKYTILMQSLKENAGLKMKVLITLKCLWGQKKCRLADFWSYYDWSKPNNKSWSWSSESA